MESRQSLVIGGIVLLLLFGGVYLLYNAGFFAPPIPTLTELQSEIVVEGLDYPTHVISPFTFSGSVTPDWFDEDGTFPIEMRDGETNLVGTTKAQAQGSADANGYVRFTATIYFTEPAGEEGTITLNKVNLKKIPGNNYARSFEVSFVEPTE